MVAETGMVKPTNKIVVDSKGIHEQTKKVETATSMYPGRLVKKGTNDDDVIVATAAGDAYAWLGYEQTAKKYRPLTVDTIYVINDQVTVINGPGIILVASVSGEATYSKGDRFKIGGSGQLCAGTDGSDHIVAIAEETATVVSAGTDMMVRSLI